MNEMTRINPGFSDIFFDEFIAESKPLKSKECGLFRIVFLIFLKNGE